MKEKFKDNKLDTGLEHGEKDQTGALKISAAQKIKKPGPVDRDSKRFKY